MTTTTTTTQPTWREEIQKLIDHAQSNLTEQQGRFNDYAKRNGITEAIKWRADDLAKAEGAFRLFGAIAQLMKLGDDMKTTDADLAREILKLIENSLRTALNEAGNGHNSTSQFTNEIERYKLAGFISVLNDQFGSGAGEIQRIISKSGVIGG